MANASGAAAGARSAGIDAPVARWRVPDIAEAVKVTTSGLLSAVVSISLNVALAALIFGPGLEDALPAGTGVLLMGSAVMATVGALRSQIPAVVIGPQDGPATVLATAGAAMVAAGTAGAGDTVLAMLVVSGVGVGCLLYLLGRFRLGRFLRFLPFPVMAGFTAGIGLVLLDAGLTQVTEGWTASSALSADLLAQWLPAVLLAVALAVQLQTGRLGVRAVPFLFAGAVVALHAVRLAAGLDLDEAIERGWFIGPFPEGSLWTPDALAAPARADWGAVVGQLGTLATMLLLVPLHMLLNTASVEHDLRSDLNLEQELRVTGMANVLAAGVGSPPGYIHLSNTLLASRMVGRRRGVGLVIAAATLVVIAIGGQVLSIIPTSVVGGVLMALGAALVYDKLWRTARRVSRSEALVIVVIAAAIPTLGFLVGIALGIALAVGLFVVRCSRIRAVRSEMTGRLRRSNVQRSRTESLVLDREGDRTLVLELEGFMFFGTAEALLSPIRHRLQQGPPLRFVILDFRRVTGIDASAAVAIDRLVHLGFDRSFEVVVSGLREGSGADALPGVQVTADIDRALEWCEDRILAAEAIPDDAPDDGFTAVFGNAADALRPHFTLEARPAGSRLLVQGEPSPGLYFLEQGRASISVEGGGDTALRRRYLLPGTIVGEISSYLGGRCTATVRLETDGVVRHLRPESLEALADVDPLAAAALHRAVARVLAERVLHSDRVIGHLLE